MWMVMMGGSWQPADTDAVVQEWIRQGAVGPDTMIRHSSWAQPRRLADVPVFQQFAHAAGVAAPPLSAATPPQQQQAAALRKRHSEQNKRLLLVVAVGVAEVVLFAISYGAAGRSIGAAVVLMALPVVATAALAAGTVLGSAPPFLKSTARVARRHWAIVSSLVAVLLLAGVAGYSTNRSRSEQCRSAVAAVKDAKSREMPADQAGPLLRDLRVKAETGAVWCREAGMNREAASLQSAMADIDRELDAVRQQEEKARAEAERKRKEQEAKELAERKRKAAAEFPSRVKDLDAKITTATGLAAQKSYRAAGEQLARVREELDFLVGTDAEKSPDWSRLKKRLEAQEQIVRPQIEKLDQEERQRAAAQTAYKERCGPKPTVSAWDGEVVGIESYVKRSAHDPDSIDVENCTVPVLTEGDCWSTVCEVRGKNAFGALVLNRIRFYLGKHPENDALSTVLKQESL